MDDEKPPRESSPADVELAELMRSDGEQTDRGAGPEAKELALPTAYSS